MRGRLLPVAALLAAIAAGPALIGPLGLPAAAEPAGIPYAAPAAGRPLGTDHLGRSVLSGVLQGGAALVFVAVAIGFLVTACAVVLGCFSALHPRLGFVVDALADAAILVPAVLVLMAIAVIWPDAGAPALIGACTVLGTPYATRVLASAAAGVARRGWVTAARAGGIGELSVIAVDILPNLRGVLGAVLGLRIVEALYLVSVASFLGVDGGLGDFAWSAMVRANAGGILINPAAVIAPAALLAATAVTVLLATAPRGLRGLDGGEAGR